MRTVLLHDRPTLAAALLGSPELHLYELGDLDDFFFPHTTWYALEDAGRVEAVALLYSGMELPTLLALGPPGDRAVGALLRAVRRLLPRRFYAHLAEGTLDALTPDYAATWGGLHLKMALTEPARLDDVDVAGVTPLGPEHAAELSAFYARSYPGNWFDPRTLETGAFFGARRGGELVSAAGVHVLSEAYRVAALGSVATRPDARGQGLSRRTTAALCRALRGRVDRIGLNVEAGNEAAIACYRALGFAEVGRYEEHMLAARGLDAA